jgi:hypothetical protein
VSGKSFSVAFAAIAGERIQRKDYIIVASLIATFSMDEMTFCRDTDRHCRLGPAPIAKDTGNVRK